MKLHFVYTPMVNLTPRMRTGHSLSLELSTKTDVWGGRKVYAWTAYFGDRPLFELCLEFKMGLVGFTMFGVGMYLSWPGSSII